MFVADLSIIACFSTQSPTANGAFYLDYWCSDWTNPAIVRSNRIYRLHTLQGSYNKAFQRRYAEQLLFTSLPLSYLSAKVAPLTGVQKAKPFQDIIIAPKLAQIFIPAAFLFDSVKLTAIKRVLRSGYLSVSSDILTTKLTSGRSSHLVIPAILLE
ncbi:DNA mismatch repair protein MSH2 [Echinococcus multilocularis]|uniref:DNA mismatch repair protein MSH2 n=1 Tax=Echinococcus multilocularis TaxID=6211 RepID=A0A0S4MNP5_ECHMU|nr:DNA mismatch repair protein MSH2 [Echinococcus multilocularis]